MQTSQPTTSKHPQQPLPVLSYATGAGWATIGFATTPESARKLIMKTIDDASKSLVEKFGFKVIVGRRTELQRELNGGPDGYVWSIGKVCAAQRVKH